MRPRTLSRNRRSRDGRHLRVANGGTAGISLAVSGLLALAGEGVVFAVEHAGDGLVPQLLLYIAAAGLVCTGVGVWGLWHWPEFTATASPEAGTE